MIFTTLMVVFLCPKPFKVDIYYKRKTMKKVKMNNNRVLDMVKETLERDGVFVEDTKIDSVIKRYLSEREEMLLDDEQPLDDTYTFSEDTKQAFSDMVGGLNDTIEDLSIIQAKESGIVIDTDIYSEDYLEDVIADLESIIERLEFIKGLE